MRLFIFICVAVISVAVQGQQVPNDSVKFFIQTLETIEKTGNRQMLEQVYHQAGDYYFNLGAWSKALENYRQAKALAQEDESLIILRKMGICYYLLMDYERSIDVFEQLLSLVPRSDITQRLMVLSRLTNSSNRLKDYNRSMLYDKEILSAYAVLGDKQGMMLACNNLAFDYVHLGQYGAAVQSFDSALAISCQFQVTNEEQADLLTNLGICYQNTKDWANALKYLHKAYDLVRNEKDLQSRQAEIENILAITYYYKTDYYNAGLYSYQSIQSSRQAGDQELLQSCCLTYSQILKAGNDFIKALEYYEMHLMLKDSIEREKKIREQEKLQANVNLEKKEKEIRMQLADEEIRNMEIRRMTLEAEKKEKELDLLRKEKELESSEKERIKQSLRLSQQQHEAELRNRELQSLKQEKTIQDLQIKQKEAEKKEQEKAIRLLQLEKEKQTEARKRAFYTSILLGVIGLLILIGLLITRNKNTVLAHQKMMIEEKNKSLEQKNEEIMTQTEQIIYQKQIIEDKNIAITDSILYASRIQGSVLPPLEEIYQLFAESFVMFMPLNIVSGDFYWGIRKGSQVIIAAADCTGHGVPGAFMSILGCTFLNEIAALPSFPDAAFILNELRRNVIKALRQKGETGEAQDGMDIALCIADAKAGLLHFAGANNPLYRIRNHEISVIKGDRMPIGIHVNSNIPFTNHTLTLERDDIFYIFSDGLTDQFGGPDNKKFKHTRLQELLSSVSINPFARQQQMIEKAFFDWKGGNDQVDDILLIGFKPEI
jgi:serine phosphatase RsbU (regulator of sigma subunit)